LLRHSFNQLYQAYKPDDIIEKPFHWIVSELEIHTEKQLIQMNETEIMQKENERN
jgi:hypothetical protein